MVDLPIQLLLFFILIHLLLIDGRLKVHLDVASAAVEAELAQQTQADLLQHVEDNVRTSYGLRLEPEAISTYEEQTQGSVTDRNDRFYKKHVMALPQGYSLWIGGRIDGRSVTSGHVIEIKNRLKRLIYHAPTLL